MIWISVAVIVIAVLAAVLRRPVRDLLKMAEEELWNGTDE